MPPAHRANKDNCSGHGCWPPRLLNQGSENVYTNSFPQGRQGDSYLPHACPGSPPHGGVVSSGSSSVYVNGKQMARIGDPVSCGSTCGTGSGNVIAGG